MLATVIVILGLIMLYLKVWSLGIVLIAIAFAITFKGKKKKEREETHEQPEVSEFDIYKQAADIEKHLEEEKGER
jgi:Ca2+/Na+ antiporter